MITFSKLCTHLAKKYLSRRGYTILEPCFTGVVVGYCSAYWDIDRLIVLLNRPTGNTIIALNYSFVDLSGMRAGAVFKGTAK